MNSVQDIIQTDGQTSVSGAAVDPLLRNPQAPILSPTSQQHLNWKWYTKPPDSTIASTTMSPTESTTLRPPSSSSPLPIAVLQRPNSVSVLSFRNITTLRSAGRVYPTPATTVSPIEVASIVPIAGTVTRSWIGVLSMLNATGGGRSVTTLPITNELAFGSTLVTITPPKTTASTTVSLATTTMTVAVANEIRYVFFSTQPEGRDIISVPSVWVHLDLSALLWQNGQFDKPCAS